MQLSLFRFRGCHSRLRPLTPVFQQHHQSGERQNRDEKKGIITHNRPNQGHLSLTGRQNAGLGKIVQSGNHKLEGDKKQYDTRDPKKFLQIDADAALDEHHPKNHSQRHSQQGADEAHQLGRVQRDAREDEDCLYTLAKDHQEDKSKYAPLRAAAGEGTDLGFDLTCKFAGGAGHKDDHAGHKESGNQFDPAFKSVAVQTQARKHQGPSHAAHKGSNQAGIDCFAQVKASNFGEIGKRDPHNEGRLNTFPERNNQGLEHGSILKMNFNFNFN